MFEKLITIRMLDMKRLILAIAILIVNTIFADMKRSECPPVVQPRCALHLNFVLFAEGILINCRECKLGLSEMTQERIPLEFKSE